MRRTKLAGVVLAGAMVSSSAFAIFDAQVLIGKRSGTAEPTSGTSSDLSGTEYQAAFHIDPIPLVPVAVGVFVNQATYEPDSFQYNKLTGIEAGVQAYAWLPIGIAGLKPYAKLGYPLFSAIKADATLDVSGTAYDYSAVVETAGPHVGVGASWKPVPLVPINILLELDMGRQTMKDKDLEAAGVLPSGTSLPATTEYTFNSTAFYLGVEAGL